MSRVGKKVIEVPAGVTIEVAADNVVTVKGPKGELTRQFNQDMKIEQEGNTLSVVRPSDSKEHRTNHGTTRALLANMVTGVLFVIILFITISLSVIVSGQKKKITLLVQEISILKNRVNDLEEKKGE